MAQDISSQHDRIGQIEQELMKIERYDPQTRVVQTPNGPYKIIFSAEYCITKGRFTARPAICYNGSKTIVIYQAVWNEPISYSMPAVLHEIGHANDPEAGSLKRRVLMMFFRSLYRRRIEERVESFAENYAYMKNQKLEVLHSRNIKFE
jgi:hypothetical protein